MNPAYTYDVAEGTPPLSLNVHNSESDEDSDAEDDEIGSTGKASKDTKEQSEEKKESFFCRRDAFLFAF